MLKPLTNILVVDDEQEICDIIRESLSSAEYRVTTLTDSSKALEYLDNHPVDLVLTDMVMDEYSGLQILEAAQAKQQDVMVILMTAHPTVKMAISVLKKGAYDFLVKPFKLDLLKSAIHRALSHQRALRENVHLRGQIEFLKVANAHTSGIEIETFLEMVMDSCKKELGATAVGLIEIDPNTKEPIRWNSITDDDELEAVVVDASIIDKFAGTRRTKPVIEGKRITSKEQPIIRMSIYQPLYIRRTLHGVISLVIDSVFGQVTPGQLDVLAILTNSAASAIANYNLYQDLQHSYLEAIHGLANAIEARDKYTAGHTDRVCKLAELIAIELDWDDKQLLGLTMGCTLHDIGKLAVPDSILNKPNALTKDEAKQMRKHPEMGLKIIKGIDLFKPAIPFIYSHHERWDGKGYPRGLKGEEIPLEGRLLAVADTFDAILSHRPYRKGASLQSAVDELVKYRGVQFDPMIVDIFLRVLKEGKVDIKGMYDLDEDPTALEIKISTPVTETAPV